MTTNRHWSEIAERGSPLGLRIMTSCYRLLGGSVVHLLLYPVVTYFLLTGGVARRASMDYLARLRRFSGGSTPAPGWRSSFRHMMAFAESALHKLGAWTGSELEVRFPDQPRFDALLASGRGALLLGAHFGNLEMTRLTADQRGFANVTALVYSGHAVAFQAALEAANDAASPASAVNRVHVTDIGPDTVILLKERIERGELLVIVGDRTPTAENGRVCTVDFLGAPADFAQGPFVLAYLLECPVYLFLCVRDETGYQIHFEPLAERIELPRAGRAAAMSAQVRRYAARLEELCVRTPYQWFNFYDYWHTR